MYNSNSNTIHTSPGDNSGEDFQRGMANWWLSMLCGDAITGKSEWASNTLEKILSWSGQDNSLSLYDAQGKPTERYDELQQLFATTFIAWLVKGDNLPQVAIPVGNALRSRHSSSMQMAGAKLTPEIGMIFRAMLDAEEKQLIEKDQSQQNTKEKFELYDSDSKAKGERTINIIELLIGRREDLLGRLRVVVAPLMLPAAANIAGADVRGLSDWEGFFSSVSDLFYLDPLSGVIAIALLALGVWVVSGTLEGTIRWLIYGSRARGAEPQGSGASVEGGATASTHKTHDKYVGESSAESRVSASSARVRPQKDGHWWWIISAAMFMIPMIKVAVTYYAYGQDQAEFLAVWFVSSAMPVIILGGAAAAIVALTIRLYSGRWIKSSLSVLSGIVLVFFVIGLSYWMGHFAEIANREVRLELNVQYLTGLVHLIAVPFTSAILVAASKSEDAFQMNVVQATCAGLTVSVFHFFLYYWAASNEMFSFFQ